MDDASATPSARQLDMPPTVTPALSRSSENHGGQRDDDTPPSSPRFNLPDSYWLRTAEPFLRNVPERSSVDLRARCLAASSEGQADIARIFERMNEDRENDPRSRSLSATIPLDLTLMQPVNYQLSAETLERMVVVLHDPEGATTESATTTSFAASSQATATEQATASGCCIPPSCNIL